MALNGRKPKAKVQQSVEDIAEELIALYKEREMSVGYQFGEDTAEQQAFELDFPYELTPDQAKSIEEIKADMELQNQWIVCYVVMLAMVRLK